MATTVPSPAGGWVTTVSDEVLTLAAPPETKVRASKVSGELNTSVAPDNAVVGAAERTREVPLTELTLVPLAIPGPTTDMPGVTDAVWKLMELVTVVVDPLTFWTAVRTVKVSTWVAVTAADVLVPSVIVVGVTALTDVPEARDAP